MFAGGAIVEAVIGSTQETMPIHSLELLDKGYSCIEYISHA